MTSLAAGLCRGNADEGTLGPSVLNPVSGVLVTGGDGHGHRETGFRLGCSEPSSKSTARRPKARRAGQGPPRDSGGDPGPPEAHRGKLCCPLSHQAPRTLSRSPWKRNLVTPASVLGGQGNEQSLGHLVPKPMKKARRTITPGGDQGTNPDPPARARSVPGTQRVGEEAKARPKLEFILGQNTAR